MAVADVGCWTRFGFLPGKPSCEQHPGGTIPGFAQEGPWVFGFGGAPRVYFLRLVLP